MASECMECVEGRAVALGLCSHCLAGEPVEAVVGQIARLARELEEARERERAVRDEATGYLAEVVDTLADMHYGEECSFEGGEGCLACYAQDRIAEMQDALAATPPDTEGGEAEPPAHPVRMTPPDEEVAL